ncbi:MAG: thioredoxin domain-containing protein [Planctomycetaceae bacterium]|nr:thioredoxin domain-containing protein [Planctomycetaceae bacterium]
MALSKATITDELRFAGGHFIWGLRFLCIAALLVTGYLAVTALRSEQVAGCGAGVVFDCGHVLTSRWSRIFGLPVSVPAVLLYGVMLGALWFCQSAKSASVRQRAWDAVVTGAVAAGLAAVWFLSLQMLAIGHLCLYCLIAHTCGLAMCGAVLWSRPVGVRRTVLLSAVSAIGVGLMISAQVLATPPETFKVEDHTEGVAPVPADTSEESDDEFAPPQAEEEFEVFEPFGAVSAPKPEWLLQAAKAEARRRNAQQASFLPMTALQSLLSLGFHSVDDSADAAVENGSEAEAKEQPEESAAKSDAAATVAPAAPEPRLVSISGGKTKLNVRHWPLLGSPDAKYVFVEMFDYTCSHCRATHQTILGAKRHFNNDLAIVALPVPMHRSCNSSITSDNKGHAEACELSRIAVAVWRVNRQAFNKMHDWLFESAHPRTAAEARRYAAQLVGEEALAAELALPYASQYIAKHVELYQRVGAGAVPKLLFRDSSVVGEVRSSETLQGMIERNHTP